MLDLQELNQFYGFILGLKARLSKIFCKKKIILNAVAEKNTPFPQN